MTKPEIPAEGLESLALQIGAGPIDAFTHVSHVRRVEAIHAVLGQGPAILESFIEAVRKVRIHCLSDAGLALLQSVLVVLAKDRTDVLLDACLADEYPIVSPTILAELGVAALPRLIEAVSSGDKAAYTNTCLVLTTMGPAAAPAVPALLRSLWRFQGCEGDRDDEFLCYRALRTIDPGYCLEITKRGTGGGCDG